MAKPIARSSPIKRPSPASVSIQLLPVRGVPEIHKGDDLPKLIVEAARFAGRNFASGDVIVIAQKIVSKAEGRTAQLSTVQPSAEAISIAQVVQNDPRMVEVILRESRRIVRKGPHALIVETRHAFVCANAGVDRSNVPGDDFGSLLPRHPDPSASLLAASFRRLTSKQAPSVTTPPSRPPRRRASTTHPSHSPSLPLPI